MVPSYCGTVVLWYCGIVVLCPHTKVLYTIHFLCDNHLLPCTQHWLSKTNSNELSSFITEDNMT